MNERVKKFWIDEIERTVHKLNIKENELLTKSEEWSRELNQDRTLAGIEEYGKKILDELWTTYNNKKSLFSINSYKRKGLFLEVDKEKEYSELIHDLTLQQEKELENLRKQNEQLKGDKNIPPPPPPPPMMRGNVPPPPPPPPPVNNSLNNGAETSSSAQSSSLKGKAKASEPENPKAALANALKNRFNPNNTEGLKNEITNKLKKLLSESAKENLSFHHIDRCLEGLIPYQVANNEINLAERIAETEAKLADLKVKSVEVEKKYELETIPLKKAQAELSKLPPTINQKENGKWIILENPAVQKKREEIEQLKKDAVPTFKECRELDNQADQMNKELGELNKKLAQQKIYLEQQAAIDSAIEKLKKLQLGLEEEEEIESASSSSRPQIIFGNLEDNLRNKKDKGKGKEGEITPEQIETQKQKLNKLLNKEIPKFLKRDDNRSSQFNYYINELVSYQKAEVNKDNLKSNIYLESQELIDNAINKLNKEKERLEREEKLSPQEKAIHQVLRKHRQSMNGGDNNEEMGEEEWDEEETEIAIETEEQKRIRAEKEAHNKKITIFKEKVNYHTGQVSRAVRAASNIKKINGLHADLIKFQDDYQELLNKKEFIGERGEIKQALLKLERYRLELKAEANSSSEEITEQIKKIENDYGEVANDLKITNKIITDTQTHLGVDNLNDLPTVLEGKKLTDITDLARVGQEIKKEVGKVLGEDENNPLPTDWKTKLAKQSDLEAEKIRADSKQSLITNAENKLGIALNVLPNLPAGKNLGDLITYFDTFSHIDHNNIKNERDYYKDKWNNHVCSADNDCQEPCCLGDYANLQQEKSELKQQLTTQEQKINHKLNSELKLGLQGNFNLEQIISTVQALLNRPDNVEELKLAQKTIADLQEEVTDKQANIEEMRQASLQIFKELLLPKTYTQYSNQIEQVTSFQQLNNIQQQMISAYSKQNEGRSQSLTKKEQQQSKERIIWISLLVMSLLTIGGLLVSLRRIKKLKR